MDNILSFETIIFDSERNVLSVVDQTKLPNSVEILELDNVESVWDAIKRLVVRGAPAIGVAGAYGAYIGSLSIFSDSYESFFKEFSKILDYLNSSRPTAVNLSWALNRIKNLVESSSNLSVSEIKSLILKEADKIRTEDIEMCYKIGEYGLSLLKPNMGILTHCNAGQLATVRYGTATAPIYLGHSKGYNFKVYSDETRPLLQGARLTSFELQNAGLDITLICDNMAASVMKQGKIDAVFVGCDRVAANGDAANKIGTLGVAILAKHFNIPFYICAPSSTVDFGCAHGNDIVIEERDKAEITSMWYEKPMVHKDVKTENPAFDVTDADLITAIITDKGIAYPPYEESLKTLLLNK